MFTNNNLPLILVLLLLLGGNTGGLIGNGCGCNNGCGCAQNTCPGIGALTAPTRTC